MSSRRVFMLSSAAFTLLYSCNRRDVVRQLNIILTMCANLLEVVASNEPWLPAFKAAVIKVKDAEDTWINGGTVDVLVSALWILHAVIVQVLPNSIYAPLIAVLVAGVEAILRELVPSTVIQPNPYTGKVSVEYNAEAYEREWNKACLSNAQLKGARIR